MVIIQVSTYYGSGHDTDPIVNFNNYFVNSDLGKLKCVSTLFGPYILYIRGSGLQIPYLECVLKQPSPKRKYPYSWPSSQSKGYMVRAIISAMLPASDKALQRLLCPSSWMFMCVEYRCRLGPFGSYASNQDPQRSRGEVSHCPM